MLCDNQPFQLKGVSPFSFIMLLCHSSTGFEGSNTLEAFLGKIEVESVLGGLPSSSSRSGASGVESLRQSLAASLEARIVKLPLFFHRVVLINLHLGPLAEKSHDC